MLSKLHQACSPSSYSLGKVLVSLLKYQIYRAENVKMGKLYAGRAWHLGRMEGEGGTSRGCLLVAKPDSPHLLVDRGVTLAAWLMFEK